MRRARDLINHPQAIRHALRCISNHTNCGGESSHVLVTVLLDEVPRTALVVDCERAASARRFLRRPREQARPLRVAPPQIHSEIR